MWAAFAEVAVQPERFIDLDDRIVVFLLMRLRPNDSNATLEHAEKLHNMRATREEVLSRIEAAES